MGRIVWPRKPNNPIRPKLPAKTPTSLTTPVAAAASFPNPFSRLHPSSSVPAGVARSPSSRGASKGPPAATLCRARPEWLSSSTSSRRCASLSVSLHMSQPSRDLDLSDSSRSLAIKPITDFRGTREILTRIARFGPIEYEHGSARHDSGLCFSVPHPSNRCS
jgi:hypothetical protein